MTKYSPDEMRLANELAETLNDRDALPLYLQFTQKYQESHLRRILAKVMSISEVKIRRTRGALFTYLITKNGNNNSGS
jgi:hypothetical protein